MMSDSSSPCRISVRFHKILQSKRYAQIFGPSTRLFEYESSKSKSLVAAIEHELYSIDQRNRRNRSRQSELAYILEDLFLNERVAVRLFIIMQIRASIIRTELNVLNALSMHEKSALNMVRERRLTELLVTIVNERNRLLVDLDIEHRRDREEDDELSAEIAVRWNRWRSDGQTSTPVTPIDDDDDMDRLQQSMTTSASANWSTYPPALDQKLKRLQVRILNKMRSFF